MKFRLSTFLLVLVIAAVSIGWLAERRHYEQRLDDEVEREGAIRSTISAAMFTNLLYEQLDSLSEADFAQERKGQLLFNVLFLYIHEDNAVTRTMLGDGGREIRKDEKNAVINEAHRSLKLLGVASVDEFSGMVQQHGFTERLLNQFYDGEVIQPELADFVDRSLKYSWSDATP